MIQRGYVRTMARYNRWQNDQLRAAVGQMDAAALRQDRGAFFGSIFATLNHILWGDTLWMSRFCDDIAAPDVPAADHTRMAATPMEWDAARAATDDRIVAWADGLSDADLAGTLDWRSEALKKAFSQPAALCIAHMFNHQTHHRGQVSQMLNQAGATPPVSDVIFMPEDA